MKGAKVGDNILVKATTDRVGKNLAFLSVQIVNKDTGDVLAQGNTHKMCDKIKLNQPLTFELTNAILGTHTKYIPQ